MQTENSPVLTIVTVVKKNPLGLKETIESLISQTHSSWKQVIVTSEIGDSTWEMAMQYVAADERISVAVEEAPGIYRAMNQGLMTAETEFIWFMNAGDCFFSTQTIQVAIDLMRTKSVNLVIGGYSIRNSPEIFRFKPKFFTSKDFAVNKRWGCHQSMIFRTSEVKKLHGYSNRYELAADFELVMSLARDKKCFRTAVPFATIEPGGVSHTQIQQVLREKQEVRKDFYGLFQLPVLLGVTLNFAIRLKILLRQIRINIFKK